MTTPYNLRKNPKKTAQTEEMNVGSDEDTINPSDDEITSPSVETYDLTTISGETNLLSPTHTAPNMDNVPSEPNTSTHTENITNPETELTTTIQTATQEVQTFVPDASTLDRVLAAIFNLKTEISGQMSNQNQSLESMKTQMSNQNQSLENQIHHQTQTLKALEDKLTKQNLEFENRITQKVEENMTVLEQKLEEEIHKLDLQTQGRDTQTKEEILRTVNFSEQKQTERINSLEAQIPTIIRTHTEQIVSKTNETLENRLNSKVGLLTENVEKHIQLQEVKNQVLEEHSNLLSKQSMQLNKVEGEITTLRETINQPNLNLSHLPEIIINYTGENTPNSSLVKLPHFTSRSRNPPEFLEQFDNYYDKYIKRNLKEHLTYLELIEQCFDTTTALWFQIIKTDVKSKEDFKNKFLKQFWSPEVQRAIKRRIEIEQNLPEGKLSMTEYFIDRAVTLKYMIPPMNDQEIIELLSNNFNEQIRISVSVQNVQTFERFLEILNKEDMKHRTEQTRKRNANPNSNSPPRHRPNTQSHQYHNNRSDSYQRFQHFVPQRHHPYNNDRHRDNEPRDNRFNRYQGRNQNTSFNKPNDHNRRFDNKTQEVRTIQFEQPHNTSNTYPTNEQTSWLRRVPTQENENSQRLPPNQTSHQSPNQKRTNNSNANQPEN